MSAQKKHGDLFRSRLSCVTAADSFRTLKPRCGYGKIVAITRRIGGGDTFHMGIAYCSPKDTFNKRKGQVIALGRMLKNPIVFERSKAHPVKWSVAAIVVDVAEQLEIRWMEDIKPEDLV